MYIKLNKIKIKLKSLKNQLVINKNGYKNLEILNMNNNL